MRKVADIRAFSVGREGGSDYHRQSRDHWIVGRIANPMTRYPEYSDTRLAWGMDVLGSVVVEVEADDGTVGVGVSTGGALAGWIVEHHLKRFVVGQPVTNREQMWDQMFRATMFYGRKGLVMNAISAVDLALWDLLGQLRQEPVFALLGGAVRDELVFYATGPRPDLARNMGFIGGKLPLEFNSADGEDGFRANVARVETMRNAVGDDFWLMYDCYMSLDLPYATRLARALIPYGLKWLEEAFIPDDYWSYRELRQALGMQTLVTTGEHESTRYGFRLLLEMGCADIIQPDVTWCGGLTELTKIAALADAYNVLTIPHGSSVYSYHFLLSRPNSPFGEFLMMHPDATAVVPMFSPLLLDEPVPENGRLRLADTPGFGVRLNPDVPLERVR
ncbi:MAG: L-rhamnonate dehydratase [Thermaerobacter sp.]|nr:L-rhamnonate dehydratase [Thermaerobacter sp.]